MHHQQDTLNAIEINPSTTASKCVIWLHGLGADGSDFVPIVPELHLPAALGVRFIFPHAPVMPVTLNNGYEMPAWFDIYDLSRLSKIDEAGINNSIETVVKIIAREEERGITSNNIILAGFSQGAVIALSAGLRHPKRLAGIIALSGYLPLADKVIGNASPANRETPIFVAHGSEDNVVPYSHGKGTYTALKRAGFAATWHSYEMQHSVCGEEVSDIGKWMQDVLR